MKVIFYVRIFKFFKKKSVKFETFGVNFWLDFRKFLVHFLTNYSNLFFVKSHSNLISWFFGIDFPQNFCNFKITLYTWEFNKMIDNFIKFFSSFIKYFSFKTCDLPCLFGNFTFNKTFFLTKIFQKNRPFFLWIIQFSNNNYTH